MKRIEWLLARKEETVLNVFNLKLMVREHDTVAILMYGSPDPDAVASAMALKEILQQTKPLAKCIFVATEPVIRHQNAEFIREMKVDIQILDKVDLAEYRLIALVDGQPTFFGERLGEVKPQIVLDHHPCKSTWHASLADVRPSYGALSTIMTEYLLAARVRIPKRLYTALLYGIRSDTVNFEREVSLEDIGAYYLTFSRANRQLIRRIELNQIPERFDLDSVLDVSLPQDKLQQANIANLLSTGDDPLMPKSWVREHVLGEGQPEEMQMNVWSEQAARMMMQGFYEQLLPAVMGKMNQMMGNTPSSPSGGQQGALQGQSPPAMESPMGTPGLPPEMMAAGAQGPDQGPMV